MRSRRRWAIACLLLCGVCGAAAAGLASREADLQQRAAAGAEGGGDQDAEEADREADPAREDDAPEALPPLQEEHAYFAALDLDRGNHVSPIVLPCPPALPAPGAPSPRSDAVRAGRRRAQLR